MSRSKLRIIGPWPAWSPDVRQAELGEGVQRRSVLIRALPGVEPLPSTLSRLQRQSARIARAPPAGLLKQVHVTALSGAAALVYDHLEAASLARVFQAQATRASLLPVRVCAEIAAQVASTLSVQNQWHSENYPEHPIGHRGPGTDDILITRHGEVLLAGICSGPPPTPLLGYSAPEGPGGADATAYGLGAVVAAIYTGRRPPAASSDPQRHREGIRTVLQALQARPGEPVPESLLRLVGACMQLHPTDRPGLEQVAAGLARIADKARGPGVRAWAGVAIPTTMSWGRPMPSLDTGRAGASEPHQRLGPRLDSAEVQDEDDPTMVASPEETLAMRAQLRQVLREDTLEAPPVPVAPLRPTLEAVPSGFPESLGANPTLMPDDFDDESAEATHLFNQPALARLRGLDEEEPTVALRRSDIAALTSEDLESDIGPILAPLSGPREPTISIGEISDSPPPPPPPPPAEPAAKKRRWGLLAMLALGLLGVAAGALWGMRERESLPEELEGPELVLEGEQPQDLVRADEVRADEVEQEQPAQAETQPNADTVAKAKAQAEAEAQPQAEAQAEVDAAAARAAEASAEAEREQAREREVQRALAERDAEQAAQAQADRARADRARADRAEAERARAEAARAEAASGRDDEAVAEVRQPRVLVLPAEEEQEQPAEIVPRLGTSTEAATEQPQEEAQPPPAPAASTFQVTFISGDPTVTALKVKCHRGSPSGTGPVVVRDAEAGPCRIQGTTAAGSQVAFFTIQGAGSYTCFSGGSRECH